jgi:hypothetical protein
LRQLVSETRFSSINRVEVFLRVRMWAQAPVWTRAIR